MDWLEPDARAELVTLVSMMNFLFPIGDLKNTSYCVDELKKQRESLETLGSNLERKLADLRTSERHISQTVEAFKVQKEKLISEINKITVSLDEWAARFPPAMIETFKKGTGPGNASDVVVNWYFFELSKFFSRGGSIQWKEMNRFIHEEVGAWIGDEKKGMSIPFLFLPPGAKADDFTAERLEQRVRRHIDRCAARNIDCHLLKVSSPTFADLLSDLTYEFPNKN